MPFSHDFSGGFCPHNSGRSQAKQGDMGTFIQKACLAGLDIPERLPPVFHSSSCTPGIPDAGSFVPLVLCRVHHVSEFHFVHRGSNVHIGYAVEISQVKGSLVGGSVFSHQPSAVRQNTTLSPGWLRRGLQNHRHAA